MSSPEVIFRYFPELDSTQREKFTALAPLFAEWNAQINVISRKDMEHFYVRHVLHGLAIAKVIQFKPGTSVLDVGTGGGFPGVPLAILFPEVQFHLVDSIAKKIKVVRDVAERLQLQNVKAAQARAEELPGKYHFVVNRAVAPMPKLVHWVKERIDSQSINTLPNGILSLKGGDLRDELEPFKKRTEIFPISSFFDDPFFETKQVVYIQL